MKRFVISLLFGFGVVAQAAASGPAVVGGVWNMAGAADVTLYGVEAGRMVPRITCRLDDEHRFWFAFDVKEEGFFVLGSGHAQDMQNKYVFYLAPNDVLGVAADAEGLELGDGNTAQNVALMQWYGRLIAGGEYVAQPTGNARFDAEFERLRMSMLPAGKVTLAELTADDALLRNPFGMRILEQLLDADEPLESRLAAVTDSAVKGEVVLAAASQFSTSVGFEDLMARYGDYMVRPDQQRRAAAIGTQLAEYERAAKPKTIDFGGVDADGKRIALSDLRGKMVFVDVWATWCAPCIAELPHLKALIGEYAGRDIVFLGVSIDDAKDKPKWLDFLEKNGTHGVQIFSGDGWDSEIARAYNIGGIPRFMLFDSAGNVISTAAPRPSSPEIRVLIDKYLAK